MEDLPRKTGGPAGGPDDVERLELHLLLEALYDQHGLDFRGYAPASLKRRLWKRAHAEGLVTLSELQEEVLHDPACLDRLVADLTVTVTAMFRDPDFYAAFRDKVASYLRTYPFVRIWHAGCSTGEEVYSMAILLSEEGLGDRFRIYATDISEDALDRARAGVFPLERMKEYSENYVKAGGRASLSDYYTARYGNARFRRALVKNVLFAYHNLVTDGSFNEFNVIVCRNVLIYFGRELQARAHSLFYESLARLGVLALGEKESLALSPFEHCYETLDEKAKLYRRAR